MILALGIAVLLLLLEAGVSMVETAFFSVHRVALERLKHEQSGLTGKRRAARISRVALVDRMLSQPARLLGAILISDTFVTVALSSTVALFGVRLAGRYGLHEAPVLAACGAVLALALLTVGETVPKLLAVRRPLRVTLALAPIVAALDSVLAPVSSVMERIAARLFSGPKPTPFPTEAELKTMIELGKANGVIAGSEEEILWNLVELSRRRVSEIMTPRIDLKAVERGMTVGETMAYARQTRRSRFPVFDETIDRVVGVFYAKDYFRLSDDTALVGTVCREANFVPESKKVTSLLEEFRRTGVHVAIVVDEFGQTAGIVTLEDVLEVIFGEIRDEFDSAEVLPYTRLADGSYSVDGDIDLSTLNRLFRRAFKGQDFERLSGFIHHSLGRLPLTGDTFSFNRLNFEIQSVTGNRVDRVIIRRE